MADVFFADEQTKEIIGNYLLRIEHTDFKNYAGEKSLLAEKAYYLKVILKSFLSDAEAWDNKTQANKEYIHKAFNAELDVDNIKSGNLDPIISSCFRFCIEREIKSLEELPIDVKNFKEFCIENKLGFSKKHQEQIDYAIYEMPVAIISHLMNGDDMKHFKNIPDLIASAQSITEEWNGKLSEKLQIVKGLEGKLDNQKNAFNFVGLHKGFDQLSSVKKNEYSWAKWIMICLGFLIPAPLIYEAYSLSSLSSPAISSTNQLIKLIPIGSLTILFIYYFRVALSNFQSIKSQIMQIELRKTLCAFIQSYVEYAKEIKASDSAILTKFEDVVFTNIMTTEDKVPSTFDGLEQITGIISAIKGGK